MNIFNNEIMEPLFWVLEQTQGIEQMAVHHPEGDVFTHSLQVMEGGEHVGYALVSGGGIEKKLSAVRHGDNSLFSHLHAGFMSVDFHKDGSVWLHVIEPGDEEIVFSHRLNTK